MATELREETGERAPERAYRAWHSDLLLALVTLVCLVPFADRAFHVDDPLFVWAGDHIRREPLDPFGFPVNWTRQASAPMYEVTQNPPLVPYVVAAVRALLGESERALHLAFLLPAVAAVLGTARLARRGPGRPELAALAALLTPVFVVSATTVMCDVFLVAFWVWALVAWDAGLRRGSAGLLVAAGALASLAFLSKYFGLALVPLLLAHGWLVRRRLGAWALALAVPVAAVAAYETWSAALYGRGLLSQAMAFAAGSGRRAGASLANTGLVGLVYTGGSLFPAAFFVGHVVSRRAALALLAAAGALFALAALGGGSVDAHRAVFAAAGAFVLFLAVDEARRRRDAQAWLLLLWISGTFAFAAWINWEVNGRSILPMAPAVGVLLARRIGDLPLSRAWPLVPAAAVSLAVAAADTAQANAEREAARLVAHRNPPGERPLWVSGAWGFEYYLERAGARFLDASGSGLARGERVVSPTRLWRRPNAAGALAPIDEIEVRGSPWLAAMDPGTGAAFYAASHGRRRGPLPWAVGRVAPRRYHVMEVRSGFTFRGNVPPRPAARHLVLISVDTLRADHLGAYGADLRATPSLDALARASVRFSEARAPAPFTLPSIAGLLTGRHPGAIGVGSNRGRLAPDVPTLAARLREHGFATGAVVSNPILVEGAGLAPGFDVYDDSLPDREATRGQPERVARRTTDAALALARRLRGTGDARVFLWVHYQDPHGPYTPPEGLRERFLDSEQRRPGGDRELGVAKDWRGIGGLPLYQYLRPFRRVAFYRAGYAGEVAYVDAEVGRLLDGLRAEGLLGSAAVVFTADHGEGLGERDHWFAHGEFLHEPALRVPLLVTGPGLRPAVRHEPASLLDVVPTALALLGLPPVPGMAGVDLARPVPEREFYFTTGNAASLRRRAVLAGGYKLVRSSDRGQPAVELFRLPDETRDLAAAQPERAADLAQRLDAHVAAASAPPVERSPSPEQEEALRALGYAEE